VTEFDIAVVGSHAYGLFMDCERLPGPGESIIGWNFRRPDDGGKGSNQAICAASLGARVLFVGKVGADESAVSLDDWFRRLEVDARFLYRSDSTYTGVGFVLVDRRGETLIATDMGANRELTDAEIEAAAEAIGRARCLLAQFEIPVERALYALRVAKRLGLTTVLSPSPIPELADLDLADVDLLLPNEHEGRLLAGIGAEEDPGPERVVACIRERWGVPNVAMTRGRRGVYADCGGERFELPAFEVKAVNATGAGDAFAAGLALARARGAPWRQALETAMAVAALSVEVDSTWGSYPAPEALRAFLGARGRGCPI